MPWYSIMVGWYVLFTVAFASVIATVGESDGVALMLSLVVMLGAPLTVGMAMLGVLDAFLARNWSRLGVHSGALAFALTWLGMVIFH